MLKNKESIMNLPADKGNAIVVMDKSDYEGKLETMLTDGTWSMHGHYETEN